MSDGGMVMLLMVDATNGDVGDDVEAGSGGPEVGWSRVMIYAGNATNGMMVMMLRLVVILIMM